MDDKEFLTWIHERLTHQHNENEQFDYMYRLRSIIANTPKGKRTPADTQWTLEKARNHEPKESSCT